MFNILKKIRSHKDPKNFLFEEFSKKCLKNPYKNKDVKKFLEENKELFINKKINPWELYFNSRLNQITTKDQFLYAMNTFSNFIKKNGIKASLNDQIIILDNIETPLLSYIFLHGIFPFYGQNFYQQFLTHLKTHGFRPDKVFFDRTISSLNGFSMNHRDYEGKWDYEEFKNLFKKDLIQVYGN